MYLNVLASMIILSICCCPWHSFLFCNWSSFVSYVI